MTAAEQSWKPTEQVKGVCSGCGKELKERWWWGPNYRAYCEACARARKIIR